MNTHRRAAIFTGIMFICATVSAMLGLLYFYPPMLTGPNYLINGAAHTNEVRLGALMEVVVVLANIGTAIGLFPVLRPYGERLAIGHLVFRFLECVAITVGIVAILSLLALSQDFVAAATPDASAYHTSGTVLLATYKWTSMLGPLFFLGINTFMYSSLLYKSKLVPRPLAAWGLTGATLVLGAGMLVLFGASSLSSPTIFLILPIAVFEMVFAGWLIVKGFNPAALASAPTRPGTNAVLRPA
jgi:hypothetical protein